LGICGSGTRHINERFLSEIYRALVLLGGLGEQFAERFEELKVISVSDIAWDWVACADV
jgi:hypothetical protein